MCFGIWRARRILQSCFCNRHVFSSDRTLLSCSISFSPTRPPSNYSGIQILANFRENPHLFMTLLFARCLANHFPQVIPSPVCFEDWEFCLAQAPHPGRRFPAPGAGLTCLGGCPQARAASNMPLRLLPLSTFKKDLLDYDCFEDFLLVL